MFVLSNAFQPSSQRRDELNIDLLLSFQLIYCLAHFKGDEKIPPYIHCLIDPSEVTETGSEAESQFSHFTEDDYLALLSKNPETLFQDESYMKHLRRHAHKSVVEISYPNTTYM